MAGESIDIHGVEVGFEELGDDGIPERVRKFIMGELDSDGLGAYLRRMNERLAEQWEGDSYEPREEIIHCSDLSYCEAQAYLRREYPNWEDKFPEAKFDSQIHRVRGKILHSGITSLFTTSEKDVSIPVPGVNASVTGRLDFVDPDSGALCELKRKSDFAMRKIWREGPYTHDIESAMLYSYARKYDEVRLMYWHSHGVTVYQVDLENREEIVRNLLTRAVRFYKVLKGEEEPKPEPDHTSFSCKYCKFGKNVAGDEALCDGETIRIPEEAEEEEPRIESEERGISAEDLME